MITTTTTIPGDKRIGEKENEKVEKYQKLKREIIYCKDVEHENCADDTNLLL